MVIRSKLFFVLILSTVFSYSNPVKVIESTSSKISIEWNMEAFSVKEFNNKSYLSFYGQNTSTGEFNEPVVPGYRLYFGMPPSGDYQITIEPIETETIQLRRPISHQLENPKNKINPDIIEKDKWIYYCTNTKFENINCGQLIINPVQLNSQNANVITTLKRAKIIIHLPSSTTFTNNISIKSKNSYLRSLLINFDIAQSWQQPRTRGLKRIVNVNEFPLMTTSKVYKFTIGNGHSSFNETDVSENGILRIRGSEIKNLFGTDIRVGEVTLYGSWKGEMPIEVPNVDTIPFGIEEVPLFVVGGKATDVVKDDDLFICRVTSLSDWGYESYRKSFVFQLDRFGDNRTYFLLRRGTPDALRMEKYVSFGTPIDTLTSFTNRVLIKQSNLRPASNEENSLVWVWKRFGQSSPSLPAIELKLPLLDTALPGSLFISGSGSFNTNIKASIDTAEICSYCNDYNNNVIKRWGNKQLSLEFTGGVSNSDYYDLERIEVHYKSQISGAAPSFNYEVFSSTDTGVHAYKISNVKSRTFLFRIGPGHEEVQLIDTVNALQGSYIWAEEEHGGARFAVCNDAGFLSLPSSMEEFSPVKFKSETYTGTTIANLRDKNLKTDYLIITSTQFKSFADSLAQHKSRVGFKNPIVIDVNQIYQEFSGGNLDPTAIRNFLMYAKNYWADIDNPYLSGFKFYVVLFGSGHYDYKMFGTNEPNHIPVAMLYDGVVDDYYVIFNDQSGYNDNVPSLPLGRIPAITINDARVNVEKLKEIEGPNSDFSQWRNKFLGVADDDMQGDSIDPISKTRPHHLSSEYIDSMIQNLDPSVDSRKVYLFEYPWNSVKEKPEASRALVNEFNGGVGMINYFGHGADEVWADEHILTKEIITNLYNKGMYPIVCSFSCSVGKYDRPEASCISELLVNSFNSGAIAAISSTRTAYADQNENLARNFFEQYYTDSLQYSIGVALVNGKAKSRVSGQRTYVIMGDPSLRLVKSNRKVKISFIKENKELGDTLQALSQITVRGTILDMQNQKDINFGSTSNANAYISLFDAADSSYRKDGVNDSARAVSYLLPGKPMFSGRTLVRNGEFEQTILVPRKITLNNPNVKLTGYAWDKSQIATGYRSNLLFDGFDTTQEGTQESNGPQITIRPLYDIQEVGAKAPLVKDQIIAALPLEFEINISDPNGIDVVGVGPDEGLSFEIPGVQSRKNINHKFQFSGGDFRKGSANFRLEEKSMQPGKYLMKVTAQDLLGNISQLNANLEIIQENEFKLGHVFNSPNPMKMGDVTRFFYSQSAVTQTIYVQQERVKVHVYIYSLSGKLLKVLKNIPNGATWDGTDQIGNRLGPNVYLYRIIAESPSGNKVKSKICKLMIKPGK